MPRKYKKVYGSRRPLKTVKYSNETSNITSTFSISQGAQINAPLVTASSIQGIRKAKNFSLKILYAGTAPLMFVLIYVPQGQDVKAITRGTYQAPASLYEPNQNVIMSGYIVPNNSQAQTFRTRLARNLNSGDSIQIAIACAGANDSVTDSAIGISLNYAITF
nr:MAG TPA: hypothetical protein [Circoviridae sp.]